MTDYSQWTLDQYKESLDLCLNCGACYARGPIVPHNWRELPPPEWSSPLRKCPSFEYYKFRAYTGVGRVTLAAKGLVIEPFEPDWRTKILTVITDPNVAYILMLLGIYGLIYELANPGFILPGIVGTICLLLALYTFQILPINYAGLVLIFLGITFMVAEAFVPSFGALGIGGVIAFVAGSVILMDEEGMRISLLLIGSTALVSAAFFLWIMSRLYTISRKKVVTGAEQMIGIIGEAMEDFTEQGRVWVHGESWQAQSSAPVSKGQKVQVTAKDGLLLKVKILQEDTT